METEAPADRRPRDPAPWRWAFLALLSLDVLAFCYWNYRNDGIRPLLVRLNLLHLRPDWKPFQQEMRERHRRYIKSSDDILFVGDSTMHWYWSDYYSPVKNVAIGGDTTAGLLERLDELVAGRPRKVFLLVGANNLLQGVPIAQIVDDYARIFREIRRRSPSTRVHAIGVLPINRGFAKSTKLDNATVDDLNARLAALVAETPGVVYIDASPALRDATGQHRPELSLDGLHLNDRAYFLLAELLRPYVEGEVGQGDARRGAPGMDPRTSRAGPSRIDPGPGPG